MTTNYMCNEWLDDADKKVFETMKQQNPRRYRVAGLGDWGIVEGLIYENWEEKAFDIEKIRKLKTVQDVYKRQGYDRKENPCDNQFAGRT